MVVVDLTNGLRRRACLRRAVLAPVRAFVSGDDVPSRQTDESLTLAVLKSAAGMQSAQASVGQVVDLAAMHGVENILYLDLQRSPEVDANLISALARRYRASVFDHHCSVLSLKRVSTVFRDAGVPWLTMKGPALAEIFYRRPDVRRYSDVDILVSPRDFPSAIAALEQRNGQVLERDWRIVIRERRGQLNIGLDTGVILDVHWHIVYEGANRDEFGISTDDLVADRVHESIGPLMIPTLNPSDALAHVGLHAALSGGGKISRLLDVAEIARHPALSWPMLLSRLRQWGAQAAVGMVLARAVELVGAHIPDEVLEELRPSRPLRAVDGLLTAALPLRHDDFSRHPSLLHLRHARATTLASVRAASHAAMRGLAHAANRNRSEVLNVKNEAWLREEYLSRVAAGEVDARRHP